MPKWLHRTTKQFLKSVPSGELPEAQTNYIEEPDLSAVAGFPSIYWIITGDVISLMTQTERDAVDAAALSATRDALVAEEVDGLEVVLRQLVKLIVSELNILRSQHGLPDRTLAQVRNQLRSALGS